MATPRPASRFGLHTTLLLAWALLSFALPLLVPAWLSPPLAFGATALGVPLGFLAIVLVFARLRNHGRA